MAKKLKTKKETNAAEESAAKKVVLVGTYKGDMLTKWREWYCYPVRAADKISEADAAKINTLWLFKGAAEQKSYKAEFVGVKTRAELVRDYAYPAEGKAHGEKYLLFKKTALYRIKDTPPEEAERVFVRTADFARSPKVRKQLKAYLESPDRADPDLAKLLPSIVTKVPRENLRVCEAAVQLCFAPLMTLPVRTAAETAAHGGRYRIASLFAGCGGMDLGFVGGFDFLGKKYAKTGFDVVWANEINPAACRTYAQNLGNHILCGDIRSVIDSMPKGVDLVMGGFPCQDISINGKMQGINGKRSCLYTYIVEAVRRLNPKVFVAENVGGLLLKQNEYSFKTILSDFQSLGYNVTYNVYHAEEYGVPQTRTRIIFVGTRKDLPPFEAPKPLTTKPVTAGEALRDLETREQDKAFSHVWSEAAPSGEQGNRRLAEDRPGYTIRAECHGNIQFHYRLPRRISMREAARIQSFPDSFTFPCGIRETERQIGNAVPPVLAWRIAREIRKLLDNANDKK